MIKTIQSQQGQVIIPSIVIGAVSVIFISGFIGWATISFRAVRHTINSELAFQIAESGIEYYRWHLAHGQDDYQDGTGGPGPYVHDFKDKDENVIGHFSLDITPPPVGSTLVTVQSTGTVIADPNISRIVRAQFGKPSFAKFAWALNSEFVRFGTTAEVFGPIHSNVGIRFDGLAHNLVTSAKATYSDPDNSFQNVETFSTPGTTNWTAPAGVTSVIVEAWGGGGAGGQRTTNGCGGGGGGGAYAQGVVTVVPGNNYQIVVGVAGTTGDPGTNGGSSSFNINSILAVGGNTVGRNTTIGGLGGLASNSIGTTVVSSGGSGYTCSTTGGGGGGSGGSGSNGNSASGSSGASAVTNGGPGGNGRTGSQGNGSSPASSPGGGGGGGYRTSSSTRNGGAGSNGRVRLTYIVEDIQFGVFTKVNPADPVPPAAVPSRPDVFIAGRQFPVPAIDFTGITVDLADMKSDAQANGVYLSGSGALGYRLNMLANDTFDVYRVDSVVPDCGGAVTWSILSDTFLQNYPNPSNGIIFVEDHIWVSGQINTARLTIASGVFPDSPSTRTNIIVNNDLRYTNYDGSDTIGLIAQGNFFVGLVSEDDLRVDAAIIAQNGYVRRPSYSDSSCGSTSSRNLFTNYGMLGSNLRPAFLYSSSNGYQNRVYTYDANLLYGPPPSFPLTSDQYSTISWKEIR